MTTTGTDRARPSLLRHRPYWRWSAATQFSRLPGTMAPLAFTALTTTTTGSYRAGAMMMVAFVAGQLAVSIPVGRLLDRTAPSRGLRRLLWCSAGTALAVGAAARVGVPVWGLLVAAGVCGAAAGGLSAGFRTLLARTVPEELLLRAVGVDATLLEVVIIAGPALAVASAGWSPWAPVVGMAAAFVISSLVLPVGTPCATGTEGESDAGAEPIDWFRTLGWLACLFTIGQLLAAVEVGALPLAARLTEPEGRAHHHTAASLIAVLAVASILGSTLFAWRGRATTALAVLCLSGLAAGGAVVAFGDGWFPLVGGLVLVGSCTGPLRAVSSVNLQRVLPRARRSEGFSVAHVVQTVGFASGSLGLGALDLDTAIALGAGSAVASAVCLWVTSPGPAFRRRPR
ncbi:MFS transporter [Streptomyces sp. NPDC059816]|uniref:MFS transporter n=1 Tax=Streptomyces sp. NPDC059816 TaxID=3346960 RepID=UPI00365D8409